MPNPDEAERMLRLMRLPVVNVCWKTWEDVPPAGRSFTDPAEAARFAVSLYSLPEQPLRVWVNAHGIDPASEAFKANPDKRLAGDCYRALLNVPIDIDPAKGFEGERAPRERAVDLVRGRLAELGLRWVEGDSGNGWLFLIPTDIGHAPADVRDGKVVRWTSHDWTSRNGLLDRLFAHLSEPIRALGWEVDSGCKDVARIVGLAGTANHKQGREPRMRRLWNPPEHAPEPVPEDELRRIIEANCPELARKRPERPTVERQPSQPAAAPVTEDDGDFPRRLLWGIFSERYGWDLDGLRAALADSDLEVIDDDGEGVFIRSPYADQYTTPETDDACKVFPGFGFSFFHETDRALAWSGPEEFFQRHLPAFWNEYTATLAQRQEEWSQRKRQRSAPDLTLWGPTGAPAPAAVLPVRIRDEWTVPELTALRNVLFERDGIEKDKRLYGVALLSTEATLRAVIGKRIRAGRGNYVGMGFTILGAPSGSGKSPTRAYCLDLHRLCGSTESQRFLTTGKVTMQALIAEIATTRGLLSDEKGKPRMKADARDIAERSMETFLLMQDETEEAFAHLLGAWSNGTNSDIGRAIELFDDVTPVANSARTTGSITAYDNCCAWVGFVQPSAFFSAIDPYAPERVDKGLCARLYYRSHHPDFYEMVETHDGTAETERVVGALQALCDLDGCIDAETNEDVRAMMEACDFARPLIERHPELWRSCAPKFERRILRSAALQTFLRRHERILDDVKRKVGILPDRSPDFGPPEPGPVEVLWSGKGTTAPMLGRFTIDADILAGCVKVAMADYVNAYCDSVRTHELAEDKMARDIQGFLSDRNEPWASFSVIWKHFDRSKRRRDEFDDILHRMAQSGQLRRRTETYGKTPYVYYALPERVREVTPDTTTA